MSPPWRLKDTEPPADIIEAIEHPAWWQRWFARGDWSAWTAFLKCLFALPLDPISFDFLQECTGRSKPPAMPAKEAVLVIGRRGGKSRALALIAAWLACFCDWREYLSPGEVGIVQIIAADRAQARTALRYLRAFICLHPILKQLVRHETQETIELTCGVTVQINTASYRTVRGFTLVAALCDELAFWRTDEGAANPDVEIISALRPAMATVPGSMLLLASSPYAKRGALWQSYKRFYGQDGSTLVWQASTRTMNPSVAQDVIDDAAELDPASARSEFLAEFRDGITTFLPRELIEAAVDPGVLVRPPRPGLRYTSFCDPSGGAGDSFTAAIGHLEGGNVAVLDCVVEVPAPFNPTAATQQIAACLKSYGLHQTTGDKYAAQWVVDAFLKLGIRYVHSERDRSALYLEALPLFMSGRARLIEHRRLVNQFAGLERKTSGLGKDRVDHARNAHDDLSNAVAGCFALLADGRHAPIKIPAAAMARARAEGPRLLAMRRAFGAGAFMGR
jgi:hypothetical protein